MTGVAVQIIQALRHGYRPARTRSSTRVRRRSPRGLGRLLVLSVAGLVAIVFALALVLAVTRAYLQHRNAAALAIRTPHGIDEERYVEIGGIQQWIHIRGDDRANPVLLLLNGGPSVSWAPLTLWLRPWESTFTLVYWDERGEGKTIERDGVASAATMSLQRMTGDGIALAAYLRDHLHKQNILVLGHSWGSILGVRMVKQRPDLFGAYIGTGQVSDLTASLRIAYATMLRQARAAANQRAVLELTAAGPPPYGADLREATVLFRWIAVFAPPSDQRTIRAVAPAMLTAPNYSLQDIRFRSAGIRSIPHAMYAALLETNLEQLGFTFKVPVYIIQGADDSITAPSLAKAYYDRIEAPRKAFALLPGTGHLAVWTVPVAFLSRLRTMLGNASSSER
jgi:pimeloyl-ACP methyl ester carboxylesterase